MRFIVDLYRYILLLLIAVTIIAFVFIGLMLIAGSDNLPGTGPAFVFGALAFLVFEIMLLGMAAVFISVHDRHAELVDELREIRLTLSQPAQSETADE